jgi:hypothetical protein
LRNSPASEVIASQPAKPHTSTAAAGAIAAQPCGANGSRLDSRAWGSAVIVATSSRVTSTAARISCTRPEIRSPNAFMTVTVAMSPAVVSRTVRVPPPKAAATYAPPMKPAAGAPTGMAK